MKLKYDEKVELNRIQKRDELHKSILERMAQLPGKIKDIEDLRRLKWINTQMGNVINEKKPPISAKRAEESRKRARDYYHENKEVVLEKCEVRRRRVMGIIEARQDVTR